jgi:putative membrane protein
MLKSLRLPAVVVVALLHFGFMALEATQWTTPFGRGLSHLSEAAANETWGVAFNMGLYNGFLGLALLWGIFALSVRDAYRFQWLLLSFIVLAGVVGAVTMKSAGIFLLQSLPALAALGLIWADRPLDVPGNVNLNTDDTTRIGALYALINQTVNDLDSDDPSDDNKTNKKKFMLHLAWHEGAMISTREQGGEGPARSFYQLEREKAIDALDYASLQQWMQKLSDASFDGTSKTTPDQLQSALVDMKNDPSNPKFPDAALSTC